MIERIAGQRQPKPLDGVGEDDDRRILDGVGFGQYFKQARQVVSGEIRDNPRQILVGGSGDRK